MSCEADSACVPKRGFNAADGVASITGFLDLGCLSKLQVFTDLVDCLHARHAESEAALLVVDNEGGRRHQLMAIAAEGWHRYCLLSHLVLELAQATHHAE